MPSAHYRKNSLPAAGHPLRSLSPKTIAAIVLMVVMGVLWLRVLTGGTTGPSAAEAAAAAEQATGGNTEKPLKVVPTALPMVEGRHDRLGRDFFAAGNWSAFGTQNPVSVTGPDLTDRQRQQALAEQVGKTLNLDAILHATDGAPAQVCINDKVLTKGDPLKVRQNNEIYVFTVSSIDDNQVVLTWNDCSIELRMTQPERVE